MLQYELLHVLRLHIGILSKRPPCRLSHKELCARCTSKYEVEEKLFVGCRLVRELQQDSRALQPDVLALDPSQGELACCMGLQGKNANKIWYDRVDGVPPTFCCDEMFEERHVVHRELSSLVAK